MSSLDGVIPVEIRQFLPLSPPQPAQTGAAAARYLEIFSRLFTNQPVLCTYMWRPHMRLHRCREDLMNSQTVFTMQHVLLTYIDKT
jgi:hypothetical protein